LLIVLLLLPPRSLVGDGAAPNAWKVGRLRLATARPLAVGLREPMWQLIRWIKANTDNTARIMIEDQLRLWERTEPESLHWTPLLPVLTGRQYVGGLYQCAFIKHHFVSFGDWHLAGRHIRDWSAEELQRFLRRYNVGWIITWSRASVRKEGGRPLSTDVFAAMPFCSLVAELPRLTGRPDENRYFVFKVSAPPGFFLRGRGRVLRVDYDLIELAELVPQEGLIVISYHWQDGLEAEPQVQLTAVRVGDDPVGFIAIKTQRPLDRLRIVLP
jgi:hypothetical protein